MASKTTELTALTGDDAATGDLLGVVDVSASATKKMTLAEFCEVYPVIITTALAGSGLHATQDKFPVWDNGVPKYMLSTELQNGLFATATAIASGLHATQDTLLYDDNGAAKKITVPDLFAGLVVLASAITTGWHATEDHLIYDDNGVTKKTTLPNLLAGLVALNTTALTGANTHTTQDSFIISDNGTPKSITVAEMENMDRTTAAAARLVAVGGTSLAVTLALHSDRVIKLDHTAAESTCTLPAASGSGARFTFIVSAVNTNNHIIKVTGDDTIDGSVNILDNDSNAQTAYAATGTDDTLTLNGTTTGGQIGDWVEFIDIAADQWAVRGQLVVPAGSNVADPFSATV
jgi:hypothetical protein